jgi:hypothetical protein
MSRESGALRGGHEPPCGRARSDDRSFGRSDYCGSVKAIDDRNGVERGSRLPLARSCGTRFSGTCQAELPGHFH